MLIQSTHIKNSSFSRSAGSKQAAESTFEPRDSVTFGHTRANSGEVVTEVLRGGASVLGTIVGGAVGAAGGTLAATLVSAAAGLSGWALVGTGLTGCVAGAAIGGHIGGR